jgi:hypothetical protein
MIKVMRYHGQLEQVSHWEKQPALSQRENETGMAF